MESKNGTEIFIDICTVTSRRGHGSFFCAPLSNLKWLDSGYDYVDKRYCPGVIPVTRLKYWPKKEGLSKPSA